MSRCENRLGIRDERLTRSIVDSPIPKPYHWNRTHEILSNSFFNERERERESKEQFSSRFLSLRQFLAAFFPTNSNVLKSNRNRFTDHHRCTIGQSLEELLGRQLWFSHTVPGFPSIFSVRGARNLSIDPFPERDLSWIPSKHPWLQVDWPPPSGLVIGINSPPLLLCSRLFVLCIPRIRSFQFWILFRRGRTGIPTCDRLNL